MPSLPAPRIIDPSSVPALRWGIVGTGIAAFFVHAIHAHTGQRAVAVTARNPEKTAAFAAEHGIARVLPSVEALVSDPEVDVVYVATPHPAHRDVALAAIAAGKHVLIEKPIAMSADEAREIFDAAAAAGVLAMEAMWTRYLPQSDILRQVLADGLLGEVRLVMADFGFSGTVDPTSRLWDPALGGGALLDVGVYPISFAVSVLGTAERIHVDGESGETGVDVRADLLLASPSDVRAVLSTTIRASTPAYAWIGGTRAHLEFGSPFLAPTSVALVTPGDGFGVAEREEWRDTRFAVLRDGLGDQATALASYLGEGRVESPVHPHTEVVETMRIIDVARAAIAAG